MPREIDLSSRLSLLFSLLSSFFPLLHPHIAGSPAEMNPKERRTSNASLSVSLCKCLSSLPRGFAYGRPPRRPRSPSIPLNHHPRLYLRFRGPIYTGSCLGIISRSSGAYTVLFSRPWSREKNSVARITERASESNPSLFLLFFYLFFFLFFFRPPPSFSLYLQAVVPKTYRVLCIRMHGL